MKAWGYKFETKHISVDENLPPFWKALPFSQADWLIKENDHMRQHYHMQLIDSKTAEIIKSAGGNHELISDVPFYMVLANPKYANAFSYIPVNVPDR